ncbi:MAG: hypothetical protein P1V35_16525, partial [Planctomycetota bacterium]|nr:hypothetical protein [Planctomycetota bacterium]
MKLAHPRLGPAGNGPLDTPRAKATGESIQRHAGPIDALSVWIPGLVLICHWQVVHGYALQVRHVSTQRWELVALGLAGLLVVLLRRPRVTMGRRFLPATLVILLQVALFPWTPAEVRGA